MILPGDWRDVLPGAYDPARAIVVTDPPFGIGGEGEVDRGFADAVPWGLHVAEVLDRLPAVRYAFRGPAPAIIGRGYPQPRRVCIELAPFRRGSFRPGTVLHRWCGWAVYGRTRIAARDRLPVDGRLVDSRADGGFRPGAGHRAITPYESALWIVDAWADPGMVVVDPFAGTGTIGRAAGALGFDYLGAERVAEWYDEAVAALAAVQPRLAL